MTPAQLARMIDHTLLRASATENDIRKLCDEAVDYGFATVSINPVWTAFCAKRLADTPVNVNACIGFPLGANTAAVKVEEARDAMKNGANEIDMVINIGALLSGYPNFVEREIAAVVKSVKSVAVKVILECSYLSDEDKVAVCEMAMRAGAAYVKTSTGYGNGGATIEDVQLMKKVVGSTLGVKAAGGIRSAGDALAMIKAGASRIGTSAGIDIVEDLERRR